MGKRLQRCLTTCSDRPTTKMLQRPLESALAAAMRYQLLLPTHSITSSMSRRGNCWDNAWVERVFGTLKRERVSPLHAATHDDAKREIVEYLEVFSNRSAGIRPLAIIPRPSTQRGRPWRNQVSTESGKGQIYPGCLRAVHPGETDTVKKECSDRMVTLARRFPCTNRSLPRRRSYQSSQYRFRS